MRKFGIRDKFGYLFGDFGNDFFFMLVMAFLMVFYTDVLHLTLQQLVYSLSLLVYGMHLQIWHGVDLLTREKPVKMVNLDRGF